MAIERHCKLDEIYFLYFAKVYTILSLLLLQNFPYHRCVYMHAYSLDLVYLSIVSEAVFLPDDGRVRVHNRCTSR